MRNALFGAAMLAAASGEAQAGHNDYLTDEYAYRNGPNHDDNIPFYCREGSFAHVPCDDDGNIIRYHTYEHYQSYPGRR